MENLAFKVKISMLWLFVIISDLANVLMSLAYPGVMEQLTTGAESIGPELMFVGAIVILIPLVMAVLTLTLKDSINRWAHIIVGIAFTILSIVSLILAFELDLSIYAFGYLLDISMVVAPALIIWHAWKAKQQA